MSATRLALTLIFSLLGVLSGPAVQAQSLPDYVIEEFGSPPAIPDGPLSEDLQRAVRETFEASVQQRIWGRDQDIGLATIVESGDPRLVWLIRDLMRFTWQPDLDNKLATAAADLLQIEYATHERRDTISNTLIAWDVPAYPGYIETKRIIFNAYVPGWENIFIEGDIDWRLVNWGGVMIDDRPFEGEVGNCRCIPAADNPEVASAAETTWLADDAVIFGVVINGEARAYPRRIMEVREMVNDTLGGRDIGMPYCTLCGAAQAYFTDRMPSGVSRPILRTSGLLSRSNKVMYELETRSVFDTFTGRALTGPLYEIGLQLEPVTVITTTWGDWKAAYPDTTVLVEELALGRDFDFRNGRDADGPIFPVGDVDPRLPVQEDVVGVFASDGTPVAFERARALLALQDGAAVEAAGVRLVLDAGGLRAVDTAGANLPSHEAFWFAWSQFHPDTALWMP